MIRKRILLAFTFLVLFALGWWAGRGGATRDLYGNLDSFLEVLNKVEQNYVDPVDADSLLRGAIRGLTRDLDPYSQYLDATSYENLQSATQGNYGGIGVVVSVRDRYPTVISPIEGSPAWRLGVRTGDVLVRIDGRSSEGLTIDEAAARLRGPAGSRVTLTLGREGEEPRDVTIERENIVAKAVPYSFVLEDGAGYVRLASFSERSGDEVREALEKLRAQGAKSAVLDLRLNPGGLLDQAVDVTEQFLPRGTLVVSTRGRGAAQEQKYYTSEAGAESRWPLVVLVDGGSASASEIVAGALQDLDRALVVGRTTYGKGLVQSVFPLHDRRTALKLTTARYYTPSGRSIQRALHDSAGNADEDGSEPPAPAAPDSTPRERFLTAGGRTVYGGGGISPDIEASPDSLGFVAKQVERRALDFRFANRWMSSHPDTRASAPLPEPAWRAYTEFLASEKIEGGAVAFERERAALSLGVRREVARRAGGDAAAARIALAEDPVLRRALLALRRAVDPADVFSAAGVETPKRGTGAAVRGAAPRPAGTGRR